MVGKLGNLGRSGALTAFSERPFTEFAATGEKDEIAPETVVAYGREQLLSRGAFSEGDGEPDPAWMPADRDSLRQLGRKTVAERIEGEFCSRMVYALRHDRPAFDAELHKAVTDLQSLSGLLGLDGDETEALAVMSLLWDAGPRMYIRYLEGANQRRMRNAMDRIDRLRRQERFHRTLRNIALNRRPELGPEQQKISVRPSISGTRYTEFVDLDERQERARQNQFLTFWEVHSELREMAGGS